MHRNRDRNRRCDAAAAAIIIENLRTGFHLVAGIPIFDSIFFFFLVVLSSMLVTVVRL